jgi:uncharacterized protein (TIGR03435 family)
VHNGVDVRLLPAFLLAAVAFAQTFDAASVKALRIADPIDPMNPGTIAAGLPMMRGGPGTSTPGRIRYSNVTLFGLLMKAYGFEADQIAGPGWLKEDRYAIDAVVPSDTTAEQFHLMLQKLLVERFKLAVDWEERDFRVYRLVVANGGPKLKPSAVTEDEDWDFASATAAGAQAKLDARGCPILAPTRRFSFGRNTCTSYVGESMPEFAGKLGMMIASETGANFGPRASWAHVVDATGLSGRFDFSLDYDTGYWIRMNAPNFPANLREQNHSTNPVSIFKAVEAQLGLKLEPATARLKAMIVRQAERVPVEN